MATCSRGNEIVICCWGDSQLQRTPHGPSLCSPMTTRILAIKDLVLHILGCTLLLPLSLCSLSCRLISNGYRCAEQTNTPHNLRRQFMLATGGLLTASLNIINPNATFENPFSSAHSLMLPMVLQAKVATLSSSFMTRHVTARLLHLTIFLGGLCLRVADVALGLLATPFAFLTLGIFPQLNGVAKGGWRAIGAIPGDAIYFIGKMIAPHL